MKTASEHSRLHKMRKIAKSIAQDNRKQDDVEAVLLGGSVASRDKVRKKARKSILIERYPDH